MLECLQKKNLEGRLCSKGLRNSHFGFYSYILFRFLKIGYIFYFSLFLSLLKQDSSNKGGIPGQEHRGAGLGDLVS